MANPTQLSSPQVETLSPVESLARLYLGADWKRRILVMLRPYFDCSRSGQGDGVVVVSGWLSSVDRWLRFETDWKLTLAKFDVPYFHMREFAHSAGAYSSGWKGENNKRELFVRALLEIISDYGLASFSCLIETSVFDKIDKEYEVREFFGNEYALCGRTCVAEVTRWSQANGYGVPDEFVFEDGDERGRLTWLMEASGYPAPIFKPSRDRITQVCTVRGQLPLQAADFAAYELRKSWDDFGDTAEVWRYRKSFQGIGKATKGQGYWGQIKPEDLRRVCIEQNVPLR